MVGCLFLLFNDRVLARVRLRVWLALLCVVWSACVGCLLICVRSCMGVVVCLFVRVCLRAWLVVWLSVCVDSLCVCAVGCVCLCLFVRLCVLVRL